MGIRTGGIAGACFLCAMLASACGGDGDASGGSGRMFDPSGFDNSSGSPSRSGNMTFGNSGVAGQGAGSTGGAPTAGSGSGSNGCARADVRASRVKPIVHLVIDGSGSMTAPFGGSTRWDALRSALMDADGLIQKLQSVVSFGMVMYDGALGLNDVANLLDTIIPGLGVVIPQAGTDECPRIVTVDAALDNFAPIDQAYPQMPLGGSTPTHIALRTVMDDVTMRAQQPDQEHPPEYVVLATDGAPNDFCAGEMAGDVTGEVIAQVMRGANQGVKTFVISLAGDDAMLQAHLEQVAAAGNTGEAPFTPTTKDDLVAVLTQIIGGAVTCEVRLSGEVTPGRECSGKVDVNGVELVCNEDWQLVSPNTIEILGQACDDFKSNAQALLHADFPCNVFKPD